MKRQQRTRSAPHPRQLHEEAFDLSGILTDLSGGLSGILTGQTDQTGR